jgi:polyisoprenyl-teichoic acid--peptidoglycan teichoic acid transferase
LGKHLATSSTYSEPNFPQAPRRRRRSGWRPNVPLALLAFLFVFCITVGYLAVRAKTHHRSFQQEIVNIFIPPPEQIFGKDRIQVLVLGIDYNYTDKDIQYSKDARSDTIWDVALDFPSRSVSQLAVPRDMDAVLPSGHEDKINTAYAIGGVPLAREVIGSFLGIPKNEAGTYFDRYIVLRVDAAKDLINAFGGIDVPVEKRMDYDDNWGHLHIHFTPGLVHMDGEQAVSYSRFRHDAEGDVGRIRRQQQVLRIAIDKLKHDKFNDVTHIRQLLDVARRDVITNFTLDEELSVATAFADVDQKLIKTAQVPYTDAKDIAAGNVLIPDDAAKQKLVQQLLLGPLGPEPTVPPQVLAAIKPAQISVEVLNGSGVRGLATKFADDLRTRGYVIQKVGNADTYDYTKTEIHAHSKTFGAGEKVRSEFAALPEMTVTPEALGSPAPKTDLTIIVGRDYATAIMTPPAQATRTSAVK